MGTKLTPIVFSVFVALTFAGYSYGHVPTESNPSADWHWRPDVLFVLALFGTVYTRGWLRLRRRSTRAVSHWQIALYWVALGVIIAAVISPIDALAATNLSMHMVQHLLLLMIAPLVFLLANPLAGFLWGLPVKWRKPFCRLLSPLSLFRRLLWALTLLPVAWIVYVVNLWAWHHPSLYQLALRSEWAHDVEHLMYFFAALLFWWPVVNPAPRLHGEISYGFRIIYLIAATLQNTLLGVAISLPNKVLYPFYEAMPRLTALSPINDQALGGGIMWVSGHMYLIPILFLVARLFMREEEELKAHSPKNSQAGVKSRIVGCRSKNIRGPGGEGKDWK